VRPVVHDDLGDLVEVEVGSVVQVFQNARRLPAEASHLFAQQPLLCRDVAGSMVNSGAGNDNMAIALVASRTGRRPAEHPASW
jgi:hypothetical protein